MGCLLTAWILLETVLIVQGARVPRAITGDPCSQVRSIDCIKHYAPDGDETLCGSDAVTYSNLCYFAQEKCQKTSITILHLGKCETHQVSAATTSLPMTTTVPSLQTTPDIIYTIFCDSVDSVHCGSHLDPVCATDGQFYHNECIFAKARCSNSSLLSVSDLDMCKHNQV